MSTADSAAGEVDRGRRSALLAGGLSAIGVLLAPSSIWAIAGSSNPTAQRRLLDRLCELVIPTTDTPGAREAGVAPFVEAAIAHGLSGAKAHLLPSFSAALDEFAGSAFLGVSLERQTALLTDIDTGTFTQNDAAIASPALAQWPVLKSLIVIGYYTSEVGGSQELRYLLIPGRFDPDVPLEPGDRAWSSDWTGVKYA
jgi:hypothetical protein